MHGKHVKRYLIPLHLFKRFTCLNMFDVDHRQVPHKSNKGRPVVYFKDFAEHCVDTGTTEIACWTGGSGPPLLLLHGYPQSHVMWHKIADRLAQNFTVIASDLR